MSVINMLRQYLARFRINLHIVLVAVVTAHLNVKMVAVVVVVKFYLGDGTRDRLRGDFRRFIEGNEVAAMLLVVALVIIGTRFAPLNQEGFRSAHPSGAAHCRRRLLAHD